MFTLFLKRLKAHHSLPASDRATVLFCAFARCEFDHKSEIGVFGRPLVSVEDDAPNDVLAHPQQDEKSS